MGQLQAGRVHQDIYAVHFLRKSITFADYGSTVTVGYLPAGALVHKTMSGVAVTTAFDAGTTNQVDIGTAGNDDLFGTDLALGTTTFVPLDEAVGTYLMSTATKIVATLTQAGTAATSGAAEIVVAYVPDIDN